ncbi:MAG: hypothetical protein JSS34_03130 [Proteobacteria bacterium]|nr:hypothetical protein [Pseudomonadota bacterium]
MSKTPKDDKIKIDVLYEDHNIGLPQKKIIVRFAMQIPAINKHFKNTSESEKLAEKSVISILETPAENEKNDAKK